MLDSSFVSRSDRDLRDQMRSDWDRRGAQDHRLHIAAGHQGSEEEFLASGEQDLAGLVLDGIDLERGAKTLEIGCGVGRLLLPLAKRVAVVHGVDISRVMIEKSKDYAARVPNIFTSVTDGTLVNHPDASLDFVFSFIVFQHIPDRAPIRTYVEESVRVLKPGGVLRFQVDGRWWWKYEKGRADTYDGVRFSPGEVHDLLLGLPLSLVDEWGAGGHYHWVTAQKEGRGAAVRLSTRAWDIPLLASILGRLESQDPKRDAVDIREGKKTLYPHLQRFERRLAGSEDEVFVDEAYWTLLGRKPDDDGRAFHVAVLKHRLENRAALLDTFVMSREFLDLVRPFVREVSGNVACEILGRLGETPESAGFVDLVELIVHRLDGLSPAAAVEIASQAVHGFPPDEAASRHYEGLMASHTDGTRLFVRELLSSRGFL
jgi:SAM-dependent methyltransferase